MLAKERIKREELTNLGLPSQRDWRWGRGDMTRVYGVHRCLGIERGDGGICHWSMLFLQLSTLLPLLPLYFLPLKNREHLLVLDSQLPSLELHMVHRLDDYRSLFGRSEVCKCQPPENSAIEVVVEGVGKREVHLCHELHELLLLDSKGDVLDDNGGRDELVVLRRSAHALGPSLQLLIVGAVVTVHLMLVGEHAHILLWHRGRHRGVHPSLDSVKLVLKI